MTREPTMARSTATGAAIVGVFVAVVFEKSATFSCQCHSRRESSAKFGSAKFRSQARCFGTNDMVSNAASQWPFCCPNGSAVIGTTCPIVGRSNSNPQDDHYAHLELDKAEVVHNEPRRLLGAGTFGAVFAGTLNGRAVALKHVAIDENGRRGVPLAAFWKEVDTQYKLRDPGVAIVWGACACTHPPEPASASAPEHRTPCRVVVMELANASLGALLSLEPPLVGAPAATDALSVADVVTLLRQVRAIAPVTPRSSHAR